MELEFYVKDKYDGKTLREVLSGELNMSKNMIKRVKLYGSLDVNGIHTRVIDKVKANDLIYIKYDDDSGKLNEDAGIPILFEDEWLGICVKPANMVTHPTHGHLDDSLLTVLGTTCDNSLHPIMRLDRETSGLIAIAKNGYAHNQVATSKMNKKYLAVVYGKFQNDSGRIDMPIKRKEGSIMIREVPSDGSGHPSITNYRTLLYDKTNDISLVEFILETGRCHQIRVHSMTNGHPLVGDGLYGPNSIDNPNNSFPKSEELDNKIGRQALHAYYLSVIHPITNEEMTFKSQLPDDMRMLFAEELQEEIIRICSSL